MSVRLSFKPINSATLMSVHWVWGSAHGRDQASQRNDATISQAQVKSRLGWVTSFSTNKVALKSPIAPGFCCSMISDSSVTSGSTANSPPFVPVMSGTMHQGLQNAQQYTGETKDCERPPSVRHYRAGGQRQYQLIDRPRGTAKRGGRSVALLT